MENELSNSIKQVTEPEETPTINLQNQATKSTKSTKPLIIILAILFALSLGTAAVFAYLYFSNNSQTLASTPNTTPEITEPTEPENEPEANTVSIAQVESLLRDKYKFDARETVFIDGWPRYIEKLNQADKILFTIYQLWDNGIPAAVQNISFDDFNNTYVYYFGSTEPLEKKDYQLDSVISKIIYRPENDSFDIYFPDGIGGVSFTRLLSKVNNVTATKDGFKATILAVTIDSRVQQDAEEFLGKSSQGDGKWFYEIIMADDVLEEIRDSLSAYEFNFVNDDDEYKLVSIEKI
ncbi:hypothetical protein [Candidatus Nanosyncoccus alces]|uniref:Uncharacterized protein n=1 Tax=Candidatus Nanosyncoccus alces TaxID=2171997 RepID=A0ABY0FP75_9BACT|nr:hypothetical protein [Candidatus Nanosyncoccus alces]RYC74675.1 hypothetical protein G3RUM_00427 [Candidatus Nanosyncoccus alces]